MSLPAEAITIISALRVRIMIERDINPRIYRVEPSDEKLKLIADDEAALKWFVRKMKAPISLAIVEAK